MSNRLFQSVIHQMKDAIDRIIGVIDENGVVVIGHCRLEAAKKLKLKEVPVTVASGLTEDEIKELRIVDNKTNESPGDLGLLAEDIEGLSFDGFDFEKVWIMELAHSYLAPQLFKNPQEKIESVEVVTQPTNNVFLKDTIPDLSGATVKIIYDDKTEKIIDVQLRMLKYFDSSFSVSINVV